MASERIPPAVTYRAARLGARWIQEKYPDRWADLVEQAWAGYSAYAASRTNDCSHDKIHAIGIVRQCQYCGTILGTWSVENPDNKTFLQEILEAEGGTIA